MFYGAASTETVNQKIDSQVTYLLEQSGSPETIAAWLSKLLDAIDTLRIRTPFGFLLLKKRRPVRTSRFASSSSAST